MSCTQLTDEMSKKVASPSKVEYVLWILLFFYLKFPTHLSLAKARQYPPRRPKGIMSFAISVLTLKLKRFRSFSGKCFRFFSGLFPVLFRNKAGKTPEK